MLVRQMKKAVITGAFSYTGLAVAQELLRRGWQVHTLTNRSTPPGCRSISTAPLRFDRKHIEQELARARFRFFRPTPRVDLRRHGHVAGQLIIITDARRPGAVASELRGPPVFCGLTGRNLTQSLLSRLNSLFPPCRLQICQWKSNFHSVRGKPERV